MDDRTSEHFNDSFERCMAHPDFLDRFYERFLSESEEIASKFEGTDFVRQKGVLKQSLYLLMLFCADSLAVGENMERLAERHSRTERDIRPGLYEPWIDCLVETARSCDPSFSDETEKAWRATFEPGIVFLQSRY